MKCKQKRDSVELTKITLGNFLATGGCKNNRIIIMTINITMKADPLIHQYIFHFS